MGVVSKGEFAAIINVSPGRISQLISAGQIKPASIVGAGQRAKIDVERAKADLRLSLDAAQRLGNGLETRIDPAPIDVGQVLHFERPSYPSPPPEPVTPSVDMELKLQKLEQARRVNRNAAIEAAKERGRFIETADATKAMGRIASSMLEIFEGGLTDMATAVAAAFRLPERDVKHLLRQELRKVRENAARQMRLKSVELPEFVESELTAEDVEPNTS